MTDLQPKASHFIGGRYVEDAEGAPIEVIYPATGEVVARLHAGTPAIVGQAVASAAAAQAESGATARRARSAAHSGVQIGAPQAKTRSTPPSCPAASTSRAWRRICRRSSRGAGVEPLGRGGRVSGQGQDMALSRQGSGSFAGMARKACQGRRVLPMLRCVGEGGGERASLSPRVRRRSPRPLACRW